MRSLIGEDFSPWTEKALWALEWHGVEDPAIRRRQSNALVERLMSAGFAIETYWEYVGFRCGMIRATRAGS